MFHLLLPLNINDINHKVQDLLGTPSKPISVQVEFQSKSKK